MFVDPTRERSKGYAKYALGAAATVFALGACELPEQNTNLRPEGPPDVLAVLVLTDASTQIAESATYCRPDDEKRPTQVGLPDFSLSQICDADSSKPASMVTSAYPDGWYVRIMFDELLDPDVEELIEINDPDTGLGTDTYTGSLANTQPVTLECENVAGQFVPVAYDGYYSPAGNAVTWPLGPALVIKPDEPRQIATNKMCRVTIKDFVTDKEGNPVPADQRGPFAFKIAPITPIAISPADGDEVDPLTLFANGDNVYVQFNTAVDPSSFCDDGPGMDKCEFAITPVDTGVCSVSGDYCLIGGTSCPVGETCEPAGDEAFQLSAIGAGTEAEYVFYRLAPVQEKKEYTFSFLDGAKIKDRCGVETTFGPPSVDDLTKITVTTNPFDFNALTPGNGDIVSNLKKPNLSFSNVVDPSSLDASEFSFTPAPTGAVVTTTSEADFLFAGHLAPSTMYTFTLNAGATINDAFGVTYTNAAAKTITFTTQAIAITSITPANDGTLTKATPTSATRVTIAFNQSMNAASLDPTEYTFTGPGGAIAGALVTENGCTATSTTCSLRVTSATSLPPGDYTFTLKAGATITDKLNNVYTQAADRTVAFTIVNSTATPVVCL
jgi:hypothetical protein